jgi:hypothetical protein
MLAVAFLGTPSWSVASKVSVKLFPASLDGGVHTTFRSVGETVVT